MPETKDREDVISLLRRQHEEIRDLFGRLPGEEGDARRDTFHRLVHLLSVHETAEEEIVHPQVRELRSGAGRPIVEARLKEEHSAKELLSTLQEIGPDAEGFDTLLAQLRDDVLAHAAHEEREEFPLLQQEVDAERLFDMAAAARAAEAVAPTRPHPGVESQAANLVLGPAAAIMDRARDAIRTVLGR
ncbi:hemerythrin HHE cation binding domain-containing protein [Prauserella shujinwangii]|uniref:Hemerythrin HHE cation binding domain-containing protein n=1 Tax=Prauserella shujinwangii TaxID=1453103 RepID=A0A2T0LKI5_9PSEU|nr:hemerythrin domain-containing protein [Prauserella shujinwangii]PRX43420.1 hemerythrin HHE cation binding domain-containing protein [Prauserella shujinwangii]